jgi:hypothetical protein
MKRRIESNVPNRIIILMLIPMFLIVSSSVYPAIMSSMENREMKIISQVLASIKDSNIDTSRYQAHMQMLGSRITNPSSPTPIDPTFSATSSAINESTETTTPTTTTIQQQDEIDSEMTATAINPGDSLHTVWEDNTPGNSDIFYKRDGADYDPTSVNFSDNMGVSIEPAIFVSGNNVHIVWVDTTLGNSDILYRRSIDSGASFGPIINLSNNVGTSAVPTIAVSANTVHVAWQDATPGNFDILYKRSIDGGISFAEPTKNLSNNAGFTRSPAIAASADSVHVVWDDETPGNFDILYRRSLDGGTTFPNIIKNLSSDLGNSVDPAVAISGNNLHVVWQDNALDSDILYRRSLDNGSTFPNVIKNLSGDTGQSFRPAIAASESIVHVVWLDATAGNDETFYRRSLDNGTTFPNTIKNLSSNASDSLAPPAIAVSSNNVYVVWSDSPITGSEILYRTSADNGNTFPAVSTNLSASSGQSTQPAIAVS